MLENKQERKGTHHNARNLMIVVDFKNVRS
jgi:hypothetical protein